MKTLSRSQQVKLIFAAITLTLLALTVGQLVLSA